MKNIKILLIGGAGTLGSDILQADLPEYEFFVVDNFSESALDENELQGKVQYRNVSVANKNGLLEIFREFRPQVVLYLATTLSKDSFLAYESNVLGMANTIDAAEQTNRPHLLYVQSFLTRNCETTINENSPVEAKSSYATWKLAAEYLLGTYSGTSTTLILANVLSPRLSVGAIPAFIRGIQGNQKITVTDTFRDYIDPNSFITAFRILIENRRNRPIEILGSTSTLSTSNVLEMTAAAMGQNVSTLNYEIVSPKNGDPTSVVLKNSFADEITFSHRSITLCINKIVRSHISLDRKLRLHH